MKRVGLFVWLALGVILLAVPVLAQADGDPETGVWWQLNTGVGPAPQPAVDLPEGGLWIDSGPTGTTAISAVRFEIPSSSIAEAVVLRIQQDSSTPALAVRLCSAADWSSPADSPGPWADRPTPDCDDKSFDGVATDDGSAIVFELSGYGVGEQVDLMLARVDGDNTSYLSATFQKPVAADVTTGSATSGGGFQPPTPPSPTTAAPSTTRPTSTFTPPTSPPFRAPPATSPPATVADAPTPVPTTAAPLVTVAPDEVAQPVPTAPLSRSDDTGTDRLIGLIGLGLILTWIAAIVSRRITGNDSPTFTLYKGAPPA